jgi:hypothetical protein
MSDASRFERWINRRSAVKNYGGFSAAWVGWQAARRDWSPADSEPPPSGRKVFATYKNRQGKRRIIVADYVRRWTVETSPEEECHDEYSEELDGFYLVEGWYEQQENWGEYASIFVNEGTVDFWMPLPDPPKQEQDHE